MAATINRGSDRRRLTQKAAPKAKLGRAKGLGLRRKLPGVALALALALLALAAQFYQSWVLGRVVLEGLVAALLLGIVWRNCLGICGSDVAGIGYAGKQLLELAIVLLGATVDFHGLATAGASLVALTVLVVALGLAASLLIGRLTGLNPRLAVLIAVGNSICGNSAIAAVAPVIRAEPEEIASAIALTALIGAALVLALPAAERVLGFGEYQYGVLAGLTVYAVPQVLAATFPVGALSVQIGTLVKLTRVLLLGPVVLLFAVSRHRAFTPGRTRLIRLVPWFIIGFLGLATLRTEGLLPEICVPCLSQASHFLTILAMAALGLSVDARSIRRVGLAVSVTVVLSLVVLIAVSVLTVRAWGV
ncbi:YeiH family protein [Methyloterricola oryzae]|uniref:YeiH family protein n=1 Tax=Methyloterricola oryzae TaxID=1495050 RepID=UPI0009E20182|nr:putative sulfate exporter family transporter [Methyloterricola oryzae]